MKNLWSTIGQGGVSLLEILSKSFHVNSRDPHWTG